MPSPEDILKIMYDNNYDELNRCRDWPLKVMAFTSALYLGVIGLKIDWQQRAALVACWFLTLFGTLTIYIIVLNHSRYIRYRNVQIRLQEHFGIYEWKDEIGKKIYEGMQARKKFRNGLQGWGFYALYQAGITAITILYIRKNMPKEVNLLTIIPKVNNMNSSVTLLESLWSPIPSHLISEVLFAFALYILQITRIYAKLRKKFHNVEFNIHYKQLGDQIIRTATTRVEWSFNILEPIIKYEGQQSDKSGRHEGKFWGEIIMNPINLKLGEGFHIHDTYEGYNFPKIFIKDRNTIYEQTSYLRPPNKEKDKNKQEKDYEYEQMFQAYIWVRKTK